jgi:hypothetical protein
MENNSGKKIVSAPPDGNCLFWAICLAFLVAAKDVSQFHERLVELLFYKTENEKALGESIFFVGGWGGGGFGPVG